MSTEIYLGYPPENIKKWIKENYNSKKNVPLHFTANEPNSSVSLMVLDYNTDEQCDSWCEFVYSTDEMKTWNDYDGHIIYLDNCENKTMYIQAKYGDTEDNPNRNGLTNYIYDANKYHQFVMESSIKAGGNIQFLLDNTGSRMDVTPYCYQCIFKGCTSLTQAPALPATTLANSCYSNMFYGCSSLTQAPELPATTLAGSCYYSMFVSCKSPFTFPDKTFDEVASLIQEQYLFGEYNWYDENGDVVNPIEIICSDKTMLATLDEDEYTWTLTEK